MTAKAQSSGQKSMQDKAIDALLKLLNQHDWAAISLPMIAREAGVSLADLRAGFPSKGAILAGFARRIDLEVLKPAPEIEGQPARERLFDVVMRRFQALVPYKQAVDRAARGLLSDPVAAASWNKIEVNSAQWMLAAAGIEESGPYAALKAQGLAMIFASVLKTFLDDESADLDATMRELDIQLRRAERLVETGDLVRNAVAPALSVIGNIFSERPKRSSGEDAASAI